MGVRLRAVGINSSSCPEWTADGRVRPKAPTVLRMEREVPSIMRKIGLLLVTALLLGMTVGCSGGGGEAGNTSTPAPANATNTSTP